MLNIFQQINLSKLFELDRLFETTPIVNGLYLYLLGIYGLLLLSAFWLGIYAKKNNDEFKKQIFGKIIYLLLFISLTGAALVFFRWQAIPYLASRVVHMAIWAVALLWALNIVFFSVFTVPKLKLQKYKREQFEKYLPRKKTK